MHFFAFLFCLKAEFPGVKRGSDASTGMYRHCIGLLRHTEATPLAGDEVTEVPKRKRGTSGTCLRPPLSLPDGDKTTALSSALNWSNQLGMRRDGHLALFWHLPAALTSKGMVQLGCGWSQAWALGMEEAQEIRIHGL